MRDWNGTNGMTDAAGPPGTNALSILIRTVRIVIRAVRWTVWAAPLLGFVLAAGVAQSAGLASNAVLYTGVMGMILGVVLKDAFGRTCPF